MVEGSVREFQKKKVPVLSPGQTTTRSGRPFLLAGIFIINVIITILIILDNGDSSNSRSSSSSVITIMSLISK